MIWKDKFIGITIFIVIAIIILISLFFNHGTQEQTRNPSALVQIVKPKVMPMAKTLIAYGTTNVAPEHIQQITIQNEAMVQQIFVTQGQHVNVGDPLLKLSTTASSSLNLENAKIAADFAKKELDRLEKLRAQYLATNADVQTAKQNLVKSEAALSNLNQQQQNETGSQLYVSGHFVDRQSHGLWGDAARRAGWQ